MAENKFNCSLCDKIFKYKYNLQRHSLNHKSECYSCESCPKKFYRADKLSRHKKKCQPSKCLECYRCRKVFRRKDNLKRHQKLCKGNNIETEICRELL